MRENSLIFCLHRPEKVCSIKQYRECFSIGIPMLISAFLAPVLFYTMNTLIIDKLGADGMYIFTVFFQINNLCLLIFLFPGVPAQMFGATDSLIEQSRTPFRLMCLALLPKAITETLSMLYFVQGHQNLCRWIKIVTNVGAIIVVVIMAIYTPELIWYILPVTAWLLLLVMVAMAYVVHRRNALYAWPTLEKTVPSNPAVTFSLPYTIEGVREFLAKVKPFVKACELDSGIAARVAIEELVYEIVETNAGRRPNETFDVRITDKETIFTVVLKSKGPLRNPIYKYSDDKLIHINGSNMRLAILSRVCKHINHKYMNGVNCIYLNFYRA